MTAISLEFTAVVSVDEGAVPGQPWEDRRDPQGLRLATREFMTPGGALLRVAVAQAAAMRAEATVDRAVALLPVLRPRCLAMCGVCAGRPGKVQLGDVIAPTLVWAYDHTARIVRQDGAGADIHEELPETRTYNLSPRWAQQLERFALPDEVVARLQSTRPHPLQPQIDWILLRIAAGDNNPGAHSEVAEYCPDFPLAIQAAWRTSEDPWLVDGTLKFTRSGRARAERLRILHQQGLPRLAREPFRLRVAPLATANQLVRDEAQWDALEYIHRDVAGLEMEASAIGAVAERNGSLDWLVMKGVMDFAHRNKDDRFKQFAAYASAEALIAFLRAHLGDPGAAASTDHWLHRSVRDPPSAHDAASGPSSSGAWLIPTATVTVIEPKIAAARHRGDIEAEKDLKRAERSGTALARNTLLLERYLVLEIVGSGGFADVWKARDLKNDARLVAVKVLHGQNSRDLSKRERFKRGARNQAKLADHPNVVRVLDPICEDAGFQFFVMEFIDGENLERAAAKGLNLEHVGRLLTGIGDALAAAHALQIIHRDVKPTNILIDREGQPYLTDFDLVVAHDTTGGTGDGPMGTYLYAPPEAMERPKDADERVDVYAFAMTLVYTLLPEDKQRSRLQRYPEKVVRCLAIPRPAQMVLEKALEYFAEARFRSVAEFVEALTEALARPIEAPLTSAEPAILTGAAFGPFDLVRLLHDSQNSQIYKALDRVIHRHVAIKLLKRDAPDPLRRRFRREARICASFANENIPRVFEVGTDNERDLLWFVMEYLRGKDLDWYLEQAVPLPLPWVVDIIRQMLNALRYVHLRGIVHGSVRPAHIFVEHDPHDPDRRWAKLLDFSAAQDGKDPTPRGAAGNPRYMAPEQATASAAIDESADLYSLGVTFFELVTGGRHPFSLPPSHYLAEDLRPELAKAIDDFFFKATAKLPNDRFRDTSAMKAALLRLSRLLSI